MGQLTPPGRGLSRREVLRTRNAILGAIRLGIEIMDAQMASRELPEGVATFEAAYVGGLIAT